MILALAAIAVGLGPPVKAANVFLADERLAEIRSRIDQREEPTWSAYQALLAQADELLAHQPRVPEVWHVPFFYEDPDGHRSAKGGLMDDANTAYQLAVLYRLTDEPRYAEAAAAIAHAWAGLSELRKDEDSGLSFSYHFPAMLFAADLLRGSAAWTNEHEARFAAFVRDRAVGMNTMDRANNWGNWGLVLVLASAAYLDDDELFEQGVARWKQFIDTQIAEDGHLPHEVGRNHNRGERGIWYSHFTLMPQTIAAEIARVRGVDLYDYESPTGQTLRDAFHRLAPWAREPESFPYYTADPAEHPQRGTNYVGYFEILNKRWPHPDAEAMLRERRPVTASHSTPLLTLTHGQPLRQPSTR